MKRLQIPQKLEYKKFYIHEKILRTRNCPRKFIKNLLPEKRKENCKPNNHDLNRDWINEIYISSFSFKNHSLCAQILVKKLSATQWYTNVCLIGPTSPAYFLICYHRTLLNQKARNFPWHWLALILTSLVKLTPLFSHLTVIRPGVKFWPVC